MVCLFIAAPQLADIHGKATLLLLQCLVSCDALLLVRASLTDSASFSDWQRELPWLTARASLTDSTSFSDWQHVGERGNVGDNFCWVFNHCDIMSASVSATVCSCACMGCFSPASRYWLKLPFPPSLLVLNCVWYISVNVSLCPKRVIFTDHG